MSPAREGERTRRVTISPDYAASAVANLWAAELKRRGGNAAAAKIYADLAPIYLDQVRRQAGPTQHRQTTARRG